MTWELSQWTVPLAISGVLGLAVTAAVWRERPKTGATWLSFAALAVAAWAVGQVVVVSNTTHSVRLLGSGLTVAGMVFTPPLWLLFSLEYTGHDAYISSPLVAVLLLEPTILSALALSGSPLMFAEGALAAGAAGATLFVKYGPVLVAQHAYGYALLFVSEFLLYRMFLGTRNVFRKRTFFLLLLIVVLHACHVLSVAGLSPTPYQTLTPLGFLLFGALSLLALVSYRGYEFLPLQPILGLFSRHSKNLTPIARERAIEEMATGFMVIDHAGRIADINPMGKRILAREGERVVGKELATVIPPEIFVDDVPEFFDDETDASGRYSGIWVETPDGEQRCFDVLVTRLGDDAESGAVALIHDVTDRERRKRKLREQNVELKRQNEQLDNFAGIVSHDLRNPLTVADGHLELIDRETDSDHVDPARAALDRMRQIIDDVLTLARSGQSVSDTEQVDLAAVATEAWETVDTRDAALTVDVDLTVEGDPSRLRQLFENLFRNSVEHGGPEVAVTVGTLDGDGGFLIADDGPGIPPDRRAEVFDEGFSTDDDGTGFGLAIIETIVEAHGWEIAVTESEQSGGARFEITGESLANDQDVRAVAD
ncbi:histidine kinase N-terminal 7TM domain-containing protein [Halorientalis regularis]|uniref:histidine kinase n=1 Tax=Halorientalis regularis TaxID=660518 RepID=A0A1G7H4P6_9EURY|nr:histidine kinase N-terminal 7TM domain-containing protein [Halorientalis regularis]SDE95321.1 PAS domain S-box-containing protein [Halorientalis regularis]